ncbi:hypothetical protein ACFVRR_22845 [Gottfriedia sp. NPDC057948]|uniref:hypothetical protein n=1 Tax=Gottfriedia sp. NPDC057948 TaxID=3346287 RepID=UPI0036D8944F
MNALKHALSEIINSGSDPNPAMKMIIDSYAKYHAIMVIVCGGLLVLFLLLGGFFLYQLKKDTNKRFKFEKKVYVYFGSLSFILALFMTLLVVANATNTMNPLKGLSLAYEPSVSSEEIYTDELHLTFNEWIQKGEREVPAIIQKEIDGRIMMHSRNIIKYGIVLVISVTLSLNLWNSLIKKAKNNNLTWSLKDKGYFIMGNITVVLSVFSLIVVIANTQGALAPLTAFMVGFL